MGSHSVHARDVIQAWGRILAGYRPNISIEITRECPLRCPGCYAYGDAHLGGDVTLRGLTDYTGDELVARNSSGSEPLRQQGRDGLPTAVAPNGGSQVRQHAEPL